MSACPTPEAPANLQCDPTSPLLMDFCNTICSKSNDICCPATCVNQICNLEEASSSITGYIWGSLKALFRMNKSGWISLFDSVKGKSNSIILAISVLVPVPIWIFFVILLAVMTIAGTIGMGTFFLAAFVGLILAILFIIIIHLYLENQINNIEETFTNLLAPYETSDVGITFIEQFVCVPSPQYPCNS